MTAENITARTQRTGKSRKKCKGLRGDNLVAIFEAKLERRNQVGTRGRDAIAGLLQQFFNCNEAILAGFPFWLLKFAEQRLNGI